MPRTRRLVLGAVSLTIVFLNGCRDTTDPPTNGPQVASSEIETRAGQAATTYDDKLAKVESLVPGFGGFFYEDGQLTAFLTNVGKKNELKTALARVFLKNPQIAGGEFKVRAGRYGFRQLSKWRNLVDAAASRLTGLVYTDVDEAHNRVRVGVEPAMLARTKAAIVALGIPRDALLIEPSGRVASARTLVAPSQTLRDRVRPVLGGVQIRQPNSNQICTLGFPAIQSSTAYYVVNSHCSWMRHHLDNGSFYQPATSGTPLTQDLIGTEAKDPPAQFTGQCLDRACRYSDAALVRVAPNVTFTYGKIARTGSRGRTSGSISFPCGGLCLPDQDRWAAVPIAAEKPYPIYGQELNKIGQGTGWTYGYVTGTCQTVYPYDQDYAYLCQASVNAGANSGDSGSPVFSGNVNSGSVVLYGILWGFVAPASGGIFSGFIFSPMQGIEQDLGPLSTF